MSVIASKHGVSPHNIFLESWYVLKSKDHAAFELPTLLSIDHGSSTVFRYGHGVADPNQTTLVFVLPPVDEE